MRYVAVIALAVLLAGSLAHQHAGSAADPEGCSACVLAQTIVDPPTPATELLAAPEARALDQVAHVAAPPAPHLAPLSVAPKTSPPRA